MTSLIAEHSPWSIGSIAVAHGLSCSGTCGILLDQGSNLCLLHCKANCLPLNYQGCPSCSVFKNEFINALFFVSLEQIAMSCTGDDSWCISLHYDDLLSVY